MFVVKKKGTKLPMRFQLTSLTVEDRLPPAIPDGVDRDILKEPNFEEMVEGVAVQKRFDDGCVAFIFGRDEDERTVCVHVQPVRPKLFFDVDVGIDALASELTEEVRHELDGRRLTVTVQSFANFNGYEPDEDAPSGRRVHRYYQVEYPSLRAWRKASGLRTDGSKVRVAHEFTVDPTIRFIRDAKLHPGGWNEITSFRPCKTRFTLCDVEIEADANAFVPLKDRMHMGKYLVAFYDLETLGLDEEHCPIIQWSMVFVQGDVVEKHVVAVGSVAPIEGVVVHSVPNEASLLETGRRIVIGKDPDFWVSYNGVNFDEKFLSVRADKCGARGFHYLSRFAMRRSQLRDLHLQSGGMGDNRIKFIPQPGRAIVDFYVKFKIDEPSEISWSMSHFVRKYIPGEDKEPMGYEEIPGLQAGTDEDRARLARYCVHDSFLLHRLDRARNVLVNIMQFAQVFGIPPEFVYLRGQQIRFVSQLLDGVRTMEKVPLLMQTPPGGFVGSDREGKFKGATVHEAKRGFYEEEPVGTLDWASLYPSVMRAHNLCHSTQVLNPEFFEDEGVVPHVVTPAGLTWDVVDDDDGPDLAPGPLVALLERRRRESVANDNVKTVEITEEELRLSTTEVGDHDTVLLPSNVRLRARPAHVTRFTTRHTGILPRILTALLQQRSESKKTLKYHAKKAKELSQMDPKAAAEHKAMSAVYDGRQLALKVSANSIYGACGAGKTGKMPNKDVSETVTFEGRDTMNVVKRILTDKYPNVDILYGDSVAASTPLLLREVNSNTVYVRACDSLFPEELWKQTNDGKEVIPVNFLESWTERGWTRIHAVYRHKVGKPLYRVTTHTGTVTVTEDHSLLRKDGTPCTPRSCGVGDALLHSSTAKVFDETTLHNGCTVGLARIYGMFVGDGSCGSYACPSGLKRTWAINNQDLVMLERYKTLCEEELECEFKILDTLHSSGVYKLVPCGNVKSVVSSFRVACYDGKRRKKVPDVVLNGSPDVRRAFVAGLYDADGSKGDRGDHVGMTWAPLDPKKQPGASIDQKSEIVSLALFVILRSLGYNVSLCTREDKPGICTVRFTKNSLRKKAECVKSMHPIATVGEYVYDLSTANHHFQAGIGEMILHNTDSYFVRFKGVTNREACAALCIEGADHVTSEFARIGLKEMILEFEKIFHPFLLLKKKRYIGRKFDEDLEDKGIDAKGVETERKDTLPFLKDIYHSVRHELMYNRDRRAAYACLERHLWSLVRDEVPFDRLILSKGLRGDYKNPESLVQFCVNEKKRERQAGSESNIGDRVQYVIVNGPRDSKTLEIAEDPEHARSHGLKLNRQWYFEHAIKNPMFSLFEVIHGVDVITLFRRIQAELHRERIGGGSLRGLETDEDKIPKLKVLAPPPPPPPRAKRKKR